MTFFTSRVVNIPLKSRVKHHLLTGVAGELVSGFERRHIDNLKRAFLCYLCKVNSRSEGLLDTHPVFAVEGLEKPGREFKP